MGKLTLIEFFLTFFQLDLTGKGRFFIVAQLILCLTAAGQSRQNKIREK